MIKYFKLSNVILIILFLAIVYFAYLSFFKKDLPGINIFTNKKIEGTTVTQKNKSRDDISSNKKAQKDSLGKQENNNTSSDGKTEEVITPTPKIKQTKIPEKILEEDKKEEPSNGFYQNSTYGYEVKFPKDWPLRIRSKENVSFGYVIPEDGLGAVTIEVSQDAGNEIEEAKKEAKKYPGMIKFEEEMISVDGFQGTKYTLIENMSGEKDFYILIEKGKYSYLIKYPGESDDLDSKRFLGEVNYILDNFKFND